MQAHSDVAEALDRLRELAAVRRPDDEVLGQFLTLYYSELPEEDVDDRKIDDIYSVGVAHFDLGRTRPAGSPVVRVMSPERERDGWSTPHSVVLMVTDDMPFLVDTMRMLLERHGLDIHLLVHPMLLVERDDADGIRRVAPFSDRLDGRADESLVVEAWTQIEIDRIDDELAAELELELEAAFAEVRRVVGDFGRMRDRLLGLVHVHPAMQWFADGQFVFLGAVDTTCDESGVRHPDRGHRPRSARRRRPVGARGVHVLDLDGARGTPGGDGPGRHRVDGVPAAAPQRADRHRPGPTRRPASLRRSALDGCATRQRVGHPRVR